MYAKIKACVNKRNASQHRRSADTDSVTGADEVVALNIRRLNEGASFRPGDLLAA